MAGTPQRRNGDYLIVFTIPFRGRASASARASPPALAKTQQTEPKRVHRQELTESLVNDDKLAVARPLSPGFPTDPFPPRERIQEPK